MNNKYQVKIVGLTVATQEYQILVSVLLMLWQIDLGNLVHSYQGLLSDVKNRLEKQINQFKKSFLNKIK
ncbi:hypothetical protein [Shimazuella kribbensis]|uniref:hypothetical protein n=1 Tax=Shimazuella kribbensis TaxID=139808 RepID=UPI0003FA3362|nr:hypothetical protein [Shimazuella kribbensis]